MCDYFHLAYPDVIYHSDGSGLRLPIGLAIKYGKLKSGRGIPDLFIAEPKGAYAGLYLEIKREDEKVFKPDGTLYSAKKTNPKTKEVTDHLVEQAIMLDRLKHKGYATYFGIGFKMCADLIDDYMKLELGEK